MQYIDLRICLSQVSHLSSFAAKANDYNSIEFYMRFYNGTAKMSDIRLLAFTINYIKYNLG